MTDRPVTNGSPRVVVLSADWDTAGSEPGFVMRALASAVSRFSSVTIGVPGRFDQEVPDGAFDLVAVGTSSDGRRWPEPSAASWPGATVGQPSAVIVDGADNDARALAGALFPGRPVFSVVSEAAGPGAGSHPLIVGVPDLSLRAGSGPQAVGLHVRISGLAAASRHVGLEETGFLLVLSDRATGCADPTGPTAHAAWIAGRFPRRTLVVIEDAVATVWRYRARLGSLRVDSRVDLFRLMAKASVTIDLAPGPLVARECVESLRYGVPIVVPSGTPAARLAAAGGGLWFNDVAHLLGNLELLSDPELARTLGAQGQAVADDLYGDPSSFVRRVTAALGAARIAGV